MYPKRGIEGGAILKRWLFIGVRNKILIRKGDQTMKKYFNPKLEIMALSLMDILTGSAGEERPIITDPNEVKQPTPIPFVNRG